MPYVTAPFNVTTLPYFLGGEYQIITTAAIANMEWSIIPQPVYRDGKPGASVEHYEVARITTWPDNNDQHVSAIGHHLTSLQAARLVIESMYQRMGALVCPCGNHAASQSCDICGASKYACELTDDPSYPTAACLSGCAE